jgi:hypothetical protein
MKESTIVKWRTALLKALQERTGRSLTAAELEEATAADGCRVWKGQVRKLLLDHPNVRFSGPLARLTYSWQTSGAMTPVWLRGQRDER